MSTVHCRSPSSLQISLCIALQEHNCKDANKRGCSIQLLCRCEDESIDELAAFLGVGEAVAALTARQASEAQCPFSSCLSRACQLPAEGDVVHSHVPNGAASSPAPRTDQCGA